MPGPLSDLWRLAQEYATPLLVYQMVVTVFVAFTAVNALGDWVTFRRPGRALTPPALGALTPLSVLIPARNEEAVIAACVRSLVEQDYPGRLEILILDDHSTDRTAAVAREAAGGDGRVRVIPGGEMLPGWKGKPNAIRQLAEAATGELLLLGDADCVFYPGALAAAVRHREATGADCLSLIPYLDCRSFWEHVIIPLQYFIVFATLPIRNVYATKNPAFAAANGAFILIDAATYAALGGHEPVRREMAEDLKFAQHVKRCGYRLVYADGSTTYSVRMYDSLRGICEGFGKNLYSALGRSVGIVAVWSGFLWATQVLPFGFVAAALVTGDRSAAGWWLPLGHVAVALGLRAALALRFRQALWAVLTHPLGWVATIAITYYSTYLGLSGRGHAWKGRVYQT
jgi:Glycosyltransferases, probably involved in cell wall biogenesis